jgi:hypothetical protein
MDKQSLGSPYTEAYLDRRYEEYQASLRYAEEAAALRIAQWKLLDHPPPPPKPRPWWRRRWLALTRRLGTVLLGWGRALGGVD